MPCAHIKTSTATSWVYQYLIHIGTSEREQKLALLVSSKGTPLSMDDLESGG
jgi:hypothetical protein